MYVVSGDWRKFDEGKVYSGSNIEYTYTDELEARERK
jgi:hypothetical protein